MKEVWLDPVIQFIIDESRKNQHIVKVVLFGSRARGDFKSLSDYDVAFYLTSQFTVNQWGAFALFIEENLPSLCGIDLINMGETHRLELVKHIEMEGVIIYERSSN